MFRVSTNLIVGCAIIAMGLIVFGVISARENPVGSELPDVFTPGQLIKLGVDDYQKATSSIAGRPFFNPSEVIPTEERLAEFLVNFCGVPKDASMAFSELTKAGMIYSIFKLKNHNDPCQVRSYEEQLISEENFNELGNVRSLTKVIQWKEFRNLRDTENFKIRGFNLPAQHAGLAL